jgi:hypothetical protein
MPADRLYLFNPEWQPVAQIGDFVVLIRETGERIFMRLDFVGAIPLVNQVDFGAVNNGITTVAARALVSGVDILELGPDGFLQTRFLLDPRDFAGVTPDADISVGVFQPGPADARWGTLNAVGRWDITAQHLWTSLAPTEIFSYKDQTPLFSVTNNSGGNIAASRISFFAWKYLGELLDAPPDLVDVVQTRSGVVVQIPVGPRRGRTSFAGP